MSNPYTVGVNFWIKKDGGHFLGKGRIKLLELIKQTGSINKSALELKMSYRQAWQMV